MTDRPKDSDQRSSSKYSGKTKMPQLPSKFLNLIKEHNRAAAPIVMSSLFEILDKLNGDQLVSVVLWLAEHPIPGIDPVQLALKHVNALDDSDILSFFEELKNQFDSDLWEMLTNV